MTEVEQLADDVLSLVLLWQEKRDWAADSERAETARNVARACNDLLEALERSQYGLEPGELLRIVGESRIPLPFPR